MTLARGNFGGYEFNRMVVRFSMMDGAREIQCAVSASAMDDIEQAHGRRRISANRNFCDCVIGSNGALRKNSSLATSKATLPASSCAALIFENLEIDRECVGFGG